MSSPNSSTVNIPYNSLTVKQSCSFGSQFLKVVKGVFGIFVMIVISLLVVYLMKDHTKAQEQKTSMTEVPELLCFHCIMDSTGNITQPGIVTETDCRLNPKSIIKCKQGEVCWNAWFEVDSTFIRSCMPSGHYELGCYNITTPYFSKTCYCDTNMCL